MTFRVRWVTPRFIASSAIVTFKILCYKLIQLLSLAPFKFRHLYVTNCLKVNILCFQYLLNINSFNGLTRLIENINIRNHLIRSVFLVISHNKIRIVKLEILRNVIKLYLWVLTNGKLMKPVRTFTIYLFLLALKCRIHISNVFFILSKVILSKFHEFSLIWLLFGFLLLLYLVHC